MTIPKERICSSAGSATDVVISVNPNAGAKSSTDAVQGLERALKKFGYQVDVMSDIEEVSSIVTKKLLAETLRAVVGVGGDGTIALIANRTPVGTPIALLPEGTENLLAKYLGITSDPEEVAKLIAHGQCVKLDAGEANGRLFMLMVGCGFDAEVVRRLDESRTGHISRFSYAKPILSSILHYQYPEIRITELAEDSQELTSFKAKWAFVVNLPRYAAGLNLAPAATGVDERLDLCAFREGSFLSGLTYLTGVIFGQHENWEGCLTRQSRRFRLESDAEVPYQLDGDPGGFLPLEIKVLPGRLQLFAPADFISSS